MCCDALGRFGQTWRQFDYFIVYFIEARRPLLTYHFDSFKPLLTYQLFFKNNQYVTKLVMVGLFPTFLKTALNEF